MNTTKSKPHQGRNIKFFREAKNIKQEAFAEMIGLTQPAIPHLERREIIEDELLAKCSGALGVSVDTLKNLELDKVINSLSGNTFNIEKVENSPFMNYEIGTNIFNPVEKLVEVYETMIAELKEQNKKLQDTLEKCKQ